ncbi:hypothetical protein CDIK_1439 [Cucumispora dikerogammari]|nr:hypothetical protein CDIK_1439 [Cucumispora dikerogammari]
MLLIFQFIYEIKNDISFSSLVRPSLATPNTHRKSIINPATDSKTLNKIEKIKKSLNLFKKTLVAPIKKNNCVKQSGEYTDQETVGLISNEHEIQDKTTNSKKKLFSNIGEKVKTGVNKIKEIASNTSEKISDKIDKKGTCYSSRFSRPSTSNFTLVNQTPIKEENSKKTNVLKKNERNLSAIKKNNSSSTDFKRTRSIAEGECVSFNNNIGNDPTVKLNRFGGDTVVSEYTTSHQQKNESRDDHENSITESDDKIFLFSNLESDNNQIKQPIENIKQASALQKEASSNSIKKNHVGNTNKTHSSFLNKALANSRRLPNKEYISLLECSETPDSNKNTFKENSCDKKNGNFENGFDIKDRAILQRSVASKQSSRVKENIDNKITSNIGRNVENKNDSLIFEDKTGAGPNSHSETKTSISEQIETQTDVEQRGGVVGKQTIVSDETSTVVNSTEPEKKKGKLKYIIIAMIVILVGVLIGALVIILRSSDK